MAEKLQAGTLGNGIEGFSSWTACHEPNDSLWIAVIFDAVKQIAKDLAYLQKMERGGCYATDRVNRIRLQLEADSKWFGEHNEESTFFIVACVLHLEHEAIECIRGRYIRDASRVRQILRENNFLTASKHSVDLESQVYGRQYH